MSSSPPSSVILQSCILKAQETFRSLAATVEPGVDFGWGDDGRTVIFGEDWVDFLRGKEEEEELKRKNQEEEERKRRIKKQQEEEEENKKKEEERRKIIDEQFKANKEKEEEEAREKLTAAAQASASSSDEKNDLTMSTFSWVTHDNVSYNPPSSSDVRDSVQARYGSLADSMESRRLEEEMHVYDDNVGGGVFREREGAREEDRNFRDVREEAMEMARGMNGKQIEMEREWAEKAIYNRLNLLRKAKAKEGNE